MTSDYPPKPTTETGVSLSVVVPSPSWPSAFQPQHFTVPLLVSAHVWSPPALTLVAPLERPLTDTGVSLSFVVPSPSSPSAFQPQHFTAPPLVRAHV